MARSKMFKKLISVTLCAAMTVTMFAESGLSVFAEEETDETSDEVTLTAETTEEEDSENASGKKAVSEMTLEDYEDIISSYTVSGDVLDYSVYKELYDAKSPADEIVINAEDYIRFSNGSDTDAEGNAVYGDPEKQSGYTDSLGVSEDGISVLTTESGMIEWEFTVSTAGYYNMELLYCQEDGKGSSMQRTFFLDGELPYSELALVEYYRMYEMDVTDADDDGTMDWRKDNQDNDLKPSMNETYQWTSAYTYDNQGYITEPLKIYLTAGTHTLTMVSSKEPMWLRSITFKTADEVETYAEYKAYWDSQGAKKADGKTIEIEGENVSYTSSASLYPNQDQTSPSVSPSSTKTLLNNSIGGSAWNSAGEWIEYTFTVEESGYYNMNMFAKQNFIKGVYVSRKITIDGEVPFSELSAYGFKYKQGWRVETLSDEDGNAYDIYLEAGEHTLRMECVLGEFGPIIGQVEECVTEINGIYREVIQLIGTSPDSYRDYSIEKKIPGLVDEMTETKEKLDAAIAELHEVVGGSSDKETTLQIMSDDLEKLIKDPEKFTKILSTFKSDNRACGTWLTTVIDQPLQIDSISFTSEGTKFEKKRANAFASAFYEVQRLYWSFFIDYNELGNTAEPGSGVTITLWVGSGRDQANIIKSLIDETFTSETNINVRVMIVDISSLLQASLAGQGPDVAINVPNDYPMNYGTRDAVLDLTQFDDLDEVLARFDESATVAFTYEDEDGRRVYALPETQTFPMMFYRKDILEELGIEVPTTWEEVQVVLTILAKNQMEVGMIPGENIFAMLLYQHGGEYYNETSTQTLLDSDESMSAFKQYTEFFTDYGLDQETSVEERLKRGECPIIIADYTLYNTLQVSAPDIKGLWGVAPVPGIEYTDENGDTYIDNTVGGTGTATMIMAKTEYPNECWEFLKWWTSADTQISFSNEMESALGASARVATANLEAFEMVSWPATDMKQLLAQHENVKGIPQVPGGYYTWRSINNAFYTVTTETDSATPREELMDAVILINAELTYKRTELQMKTAEDYGLE